MIRIGTQGWSYADWLGNFYPDKCKPSEYLRIYSSRFNTVEVDSSFYAIPRRATVEKWYRATPADFKFAAKFPQSITHESDLTGVDEILSAFLAVMSTLKEKLGPLLLQFPYSFKPDMADNLYKFLNLLPPDFRFVIEVRNRKWLGEQLYDNLRKHNVGLAILDHPWMPKISEMTSDILYLRFLGDRQKIPDNFSFERTNRLEELTQWKKFLKDLIDQNEDAYFYFNNHYSGHSPTTADRFTGLLSA